MNPTYLLLAGIVILSSAIGNVLRYIPFAQSITRKQRNRIWLYTGLLSLLGFPICAYLFETYPGDVVPIYKLSLLLTWIPYWSILLLVIPHRLPEQIFTLTLVACWLFMGHTISSLFCTFFVAGFESRGLAPAETYLWLGSIWCLLLLISLPLAFVLFRGILSTAAQRLFQTPLRWGIATIPLILLFAFLIPLASNEILHSIAQRVSRFFLPIAYFYYYRYISQTTALYQESMDNMRQAQLLTREANALHDYVQLIKSNNERFRILRHDMRHHIRMLQALIDSDNTEDALKLLQTQEAVLRTSSLETYSDYPLINAVLSISDAQAREQHIAFRQLVNLPKNIRTSCESIATLLSNLLENAINASLAQREGERSIRLKLQHKHDQFLIELTNRFDGMLHLGEDGLPMAPGAPYPGMGTVSLRAFLKKYQGTCTYSQEEGEVCVLISWKDREPAKTA